VVKVKITVRPRTGHEGPKGEWRYSSTFSSTSVLDRDGWSTSRPGRFTSGKETQYTLCRRLGGSQGQSGGVQKISTTPRFDPRTVQSVASGYTEQTVMAQLNGAWNTTRWPLHSWERDGIHIVQEAGRVPGSVWTGAENLDTSEIRILHRPVRGERLYRIHCCDPTEWGMEGVIRICDCWPLIRKLPSEGYLCTLNPLPNMDNYQHSAYTHIYPPISSKYTCP
jgi:hypothetical protein